MSASEPTASSPAASSPSSTDATAESYARSITTKATRGSDVNFGDLSNTQRVAVGEIWVQRRGCRVAEDNTKQDPPSIRVRAVDGGGKLPNGTEDIVLGGPIEGLCLKRAGELKPWKTDSRIEEPFWIEDGEFVTVIFKFQHGSSSDPFETTWERGYNIQLGTI